MSAAEDLDAPTYKWRHVDQLGNIQFDIYVEDHDQAIGTSLHAHGRVNPDHDQAKDIHARMLFDAIYHTANKAVTDMLDKVNEHPELLILYCLRGHKNEMPDLMKARPGIDPVFLGCGDVPANGDHPEKEDDTTKGGMFL